MIRYILSNSFKENPCLENSPPAYIISQEKVLLVYHRKLQKWLPPGGHVDANELPSEAAIREAREETGLEIELFSDEHVWINRWNAKSIPRPFLCLLEEIQPYGAQAAHQHIDYIYLARPIGGLEKLNEEETSGLKWLTLEELEKLQDDREIFAETKEVVRTIFSYLAAKGNLWETSKQFSLPPLDSMLEKQHSA